MKTFTIAAALVGAIALSAGPVFAMCGCCNRPAAAQNKPADQPHQPMTPMPAPQQ
jgi:hypothetical protein